MYAAFWRALIGPTWFRVITCLLLIVAVVAICFVWVFPLISPLMPFNHNTVG